MSNAVCIRVCMNRYIYIFLNDNSLGEGKQGMREGIPVLPAGHLNAKISAGVGFILGSPLTTLNFLYVSSLLLNLVKDVRF